ncbi:hypothetical protein EV356DRAFT_512120 [Viridothelium virens]|uniref:Uncharacterized protein n=1 Tax=Viridothelium virens TaxID=1048519 RepID=A0A6A6GTR7_VIRVR|nr:hypothetical protein EV356DRAFT_512120 [Viridothelium virens]
MDNATKTSYDNDPGRLFDIGSLECRTPGKKWHETPFRVVYSLSKKDVWLVARRFFEDTDLDYPSLKELDGDDPKFETGDDWVCNKYQSRSRRLEGVAKDGTPKKAISRLISSNNIAEGLWFTTLFCDWARGLSDPELHTSDIDEVLVEIARRNSEIEDRLNGPVLRCDYNSEANDVVVANGVAASEGGWITPSPGETLDLP